MATLAKSAPLAAIAPWRWPTLAEIGLTAEARAERNGALGGSDANIIMSGDAERILELWRCKRGEAQAEDLSGVLPVMLGTWTETFNRLWYEKTTGDRVVGVGDLARHPEFVFMRCTLDGRRERDGAVWEAKHVNAFSKLDEVVARYLPQLTHNMICTGNDRAVLSVFIGTMKYEVVEVALDELYAADLIAAEQHFWRCVASGEPPVAVDVVAPKVATAARTREVDMSGSNAWASLAADWLDNAEAAKAFDAAAGELKALVEDDVKRAHGHGVEVVVSKAGAKSIKALRS